MKKLVVSVVAVLVAIATVVAITGRAGAASPAATTSAPTQPDVIDLTLTYHPSGSAPAKTITISALSYSFDTSVKSATGSGTGKRIASPVVVTIAQGSESPTLASLFLENRVIQPAKLLISNGESGRTGFDTEAVYTFKTAAITGIRASGKQEAVNSDIINSADAEQVLTIDYASMTQSYYAPPPVN